jgi:hypothetical protein
MAVGGLAGGQDSLDPPVGVGEGGQHRMAAVKPHRLVAA